MSEQNSLQKIEKYNENKVVRVKIISYIFFGM